MFKHHHFHFFGHQPEPEPPEAPAWFDEFKDLINERLDQMATKAQIDKFTADVKDLIDAGVAEITAAVAAAQNASPDPAIDDLDTKVTAATQAMKDAAASLTPPPTAPPA